ncbi:MAG: hydantoinase B/oxoprolinase family protein [Deltaproteobacteria bacterium]|nr:MAG: hydantoinase B/oxoprolinase family protein [Deltaproteobacteria bacterium]
MTVKASPILLEVFKNRFSSIAEEMGSTLNRTSFSPNIKERRDYSCAIFDSAGNMVAQAAHIPVHLGSMPLSVLAAIEEVEMEEGDMVILNDPFRGGTHLPDVTIVAPVFLGREKPLFYVANRAHHSDIGGMTPGSMPLSTSLFQEGVIIPPMKFVRKGEIDRNVLSLILANVRTPDEREGDFAAQLMANRTGIRRLEELAERYGVETLLFYSKELQDYSERVARERISRIPDGVYEFEDYMDDDGITDDPVRIRVKITVSGDEMTVDFTGSSPQVQGSVNSVYAITLSAVLYVVRTLLPDDVPTNAGILRSVRVLTEKGSVVDATFPAAVAGGNVETSQRIVDVLLGALSRAVPDRIPAASQGTMNNVTIGGWDERKGEPFAYYETIGGGMGAGEGVPGASAVHSHMTNTLNTPVEALEYSYPFIVTRYAVRRNTGGKGKYPGGDGIIREIKVFCDADVTVLSERRRFRPYGLFGGEAGAPGKNIIIRNGKASEMGSKFTARLNRGDVLRIETPGGGGFGSLKNKGKEEER